MRSFLLILGLFLGSLSVNADLCFRVQNCPEGSFSSMISCSVPIPVGGTCITTYRPDIYLLTCQSLKPDGTQAYLNMEACLPPDDWGGGGGTLGSGGNIDEENDLYCPPWRTNCDDERF